MKQLFTIITLLISVYSSAQETNIVILNKKEIANFRETMKALPEVREMYDSIYHEAIDLLDHKPHPLEMVYYEGLLDTNPKRVNTMKGFADIDNVVTFIYAGYGSDKPEFRQKSKEIITAWAQTYQPTGNPINENKFTAFFWTYYLYKHHFSKKEQQTVENWMNGIALAEKNRRQTPNNNWEAKRLKIIGIIGCILQDDNLIDYSIDGYKKYIATAYFPDGTSNDLHRRDALSYHVSGIKPCLTAFINLSRFNPEFGLYSFEAENGASIKKSVEYVVPYATGEKQRKEWVNTKVKLDKERAAAGIEKYQPGKLFDPKQAWEMFQWACYYNPGWYSVFENDETPDYTYTWIGLLNSPLVRNSK